MSEDRRSILAMLAEGKVNADEAERLIATLERDVKVPIPGTSPVQPNGVKPKFLRVTVDKEDGHNGPTKVNIRVPMQLLRAGVRLSSLIPEHARLRVNESMRHKGYENFDLKDFKPENLDELVAQLNDLTIDVNEDRTKVRIYCE